MFPKTYRALKTLKAIEAAYPIVLVEGINHKGVALYYAARVRFDSKKYDHNGLVKLAIKNYVKKNRELFYFKNGNQRKNFPTNGLDKLVHKYASVW